MPVPWILMDMYSMYMEYNIYIYIQMKVEALQKLHSHGFDILLLSFCGWQREQEV